MKRAVKCCMVPIQAYSIESQAARLLTDYAESKELLIGNKNAFCQDAKEPGHEQFNNMIKFLRRHREVRFVITNKTGLVLNIVEESKKKKCKRRPTSRTSSREASGNV